MTPPQLRSCCLGQEGVQEQRCLLVTQEAGALSLSQLCLDFKHPRINKCGHAHLDFSKMEPPGYSELHPRQANHRGPAPQGRGLEGQPQAAGPSLPQGGRGTRGGPTPDAERRSQASAL